MGMNVQINRMGNYVLSDKIEGENLVPLIGNSTPPRLILIDNRKYHIRTTEPFRTKKEAKDFNSKLQRYGDWSKDKIVKWRGYWWRYFEEEDIEMGEWGYTE